MKARVEYEADYGGIEGYKVTVKGADGEWGLDSFHPLVRREGARENEEQNFVSFMLINKIGQLIDMGYEVMFK